MLFINFEISFAITDGEGDIIIKLTEGTPLSSIDDLCQEYEAVKIDSIVSANIFLIHVEQSVSGKTILINNESIVEYASQPIMITYPSCDKNGDPNDPLYDPTWPNGAQWDLGVMSFPDAWTCSHGEGIVIGIIDEGIKVNHLDLQNSIQLNEIEFFDIDDDPNDEWPDGEDDDGNGYIDDALGINTEPNPGYDHVIGCLECYGEEDHGTHVSSILAATTHNENGIASGGWGHRSNGTSFITVRTGSWPSSDNYSVYEGIYYLLGGRGDEVDIIVMNASCDFEPTGWEDAINDLFEAGILVISPSGNHPFSGPPCENILYPAIWPQVIAVGGTQKQAGEPWEEVCWPWSVEGQQLDVSAPCYDILACSSVDEGDQHNEYSSDGTGTCFATPHVAAVAALCIDYFKSNPEEWPSWGNDPEADLDTLYKALFVGASTWHPEEDFNDYTGFGRLNAYDAVKYREQVYNIARIWSPLYEQEFGEGATSISVIGTALAKNMVSYKLCLNDNCEHSAISYPDGDNTTERIRELLGFINLTELSYGDFELRLEVSRTPIGGGGGFYVEGGHHSVPVPPICSSHQIMFSYLPDLGLVPILEPDSVVVLDSLFNQLDYSLTITNISDSSTSFKYQIDYDYADSNILFLGPYDTTLAPYSSFNPINFSTHFTEQDSTGLYKWNLRIFTLSDDTIGVDSLNVVKQ